jgi:23S rRNA (adenine2503-C2)-methyltransferase
VAPPVNLLDFDLDALTAWCATLGEKRFRAVQLFRWVHQKGEADFARMSDLAKSLRDKLATAAEVRPLKILTEQASADGTIKWLFDVGGGDAVETVFIPEDDRGTLCVSSQAGCAVGCRFCSTGHQGFSRNLTTGEILAQLWFAEHRCAGGWNWRPTERAIEQRGDDGHGRAAAELRRAGARAAHHAQTTMATACRAGVSPCPPRAWCAMIERLQEDCPVALAVSACTRPPTPCATQLVPLNRKYPLGRVARRLQCSYLAPRRATSSPSNTACSTASTTRPELAQPAGGPGQRPARSACLASST